MSKNKTGTNICDSKLHARVVSPKQSVGCPGSFESHTTTSPNSSDMNNDWIVVRKNKNTKSNATSTSNTMNPNYELHKPKKDKPSASALPKREDVLARRAEIKMQKRLKREQKLRMEKEKKSKNTKLNFVSQDDVKVFQSNKQLLSDSQRSRDFDSELDFSISNEMDMSAFPVLSSTALPLCPPRKKMHKMTENASQILATKKKVKTKDQIQFDLNSLIKVNKKKDPEETSKKPERRVKKIVKEVSKKGKERETPKQTYTTLRKKLLKEKSERVEGFKSILCDLSHLQLAENDVESVDGIAISVKKDINKIERESELYSAVIETGESELDKSKDHEDKPTLNVEELSEAETTPSDDKSHILKEDVVTELLWLKHPIHTKKFREYCDHVITPDVVERATEFINLIVKFQVRLYEKDPIKGRSRRRFYCGMRECTRHMKKFVCIFVAPDLDKYKTIGDELVKLLRTAAEFKTPIFYGIAQRKLAHLCLRKGSVSCMGITNHQGAQESYKRLCDVVSDARDQYEAITKTSDFVASISERVVENLSKSES